MADQQQQIPTGRARGRARGVPRTAEEARAGGVRKPGNILQDNWNECQQIWALYLNFDSNCAVLSLVLFPVRSILIEKHQFRGTLAFNQYIHLYLTMRGSYLLKIQ